MLISKKIVLYSSVYAVFSACTLAETAFAQTDLQDPPPPYGEKDYSQPPPLPKDFINQYEEEKDIADDNKLTSSQNDLEKKTIQSRLEALYSKRAGEDLKLFGYDMFAGAASLAEGSTDKTTPIGAVQDNFILNIGDSLSITFSGQRSETIDAKIDSQGLLLIPDFRPIAAVGLSIGQLRQRLENAADNMHNTQIFVSLSSVQQIGVLLIGNIERPGRYNLTVFNSILEALEAAGGVRKDGSLRAIKLVRSGQSEIIDLYDLILRGAPSTDLKLRDGDRIIVPPIGQTIAVAGEVKQPAIFELAPVSPSSRNTLSLNDLLAYSGGILSSGENRFVKLGLTRDGREITQELSNGSLPVFKDGDILMALRAQEKREGMIELVGNTRKAGLHDAAQNKTLSRLLDSDSVLGDDTYPLLGLIERTNNKQLSKQFISFSIRSVLNKESDKNLSDKDKIYFFSNTDIKSIFEDKQNDTDNNENEFSGVDLSPEIINFLKEQSITIRGGVRASGSYPIAEETTLENVLSVAGGLVRGANTEHIEITSRVASPNSPSLRQSYDLAQTQPSSILLRIGDAVRVNVLARQIEEKTVFISGEINSPGRYDLMPGDRLSDLITRAGGLTQDSYPNGAIFSRESERRAEETRFRAAAKELEHSLAAAMQKDTKAPDAAQIEMVRGLAQELSTVEALGRITVEADPSTLQSQPELDMLLEEGDRLYIPKRPLTVRVSGEILSPASLQFRKDKDPVTYIEEAGGFTFHADKGRSFVLYPDGSAQPLKVSAWNHDPVFIPPGSTIVIPRDPKPFDFIESARDFTQILSNLAVTSIFIDDLRD